MPQIPSHRSLLSANFWDRHSMRAILHGSQTQRALRYSRNALCTTWKIVRLLCPDVGNVFRKRVFLFFAECPGGLEVIVVDKCVDCMMHVAIVGGLQIRNADLIID